MSDLQERRRVAEELLQRRGFERRSADTGPIEIREASDGKLHISGYASVFDRPYEVGPFTETVHRAAFTKSLRELKRGVHLLANHGGLPLASTLNDTLQLREDQVGLHYDGTLDPDDHDSQTIVRKIRSGLMQECSFAFQPVRQKWSEDRSQRHLYEVSIDGGDVSVVNFGASPATSVQARSAGTAGTLLVPDYSAAAKLALARARARPYERRAEKYTQKQIDELGRQGKAFRHANGTYSYPIADREDVKDAVRAVGGRSDPSEKPAIRKFIMQRAKALACFNCIPASWNSDGTLKTGGSRSAVLLPDYSQHARRQLEAARRR